MTGPESQRWRDTMTKIMLLQEPISCRSPSVRERQLLGNEQLLFDAVVKTFRVEESVPCEGDKSGRPMATTRRRRASDRVSCASLGVMCGNSRASEYHQLLLELPFLHTGKGCLMRDSGEEGMS